jgi:hypothetical protein
LASADIGFPVDADYGRELTAKKTTIEEAWRFGCAREFRGLGI